MSSLLLTGARIVDPFGPVGVVDNAHILIEDGTILSAGIEPPRVKAGESVDLNGAVVLPGLINMHTHLYSALAMGMPAPPVAPASFGQILKRVWWVLDRALNADTVRASFEAGLLECLRAGVTTVVDHHSSQTFVRGSLEPGVTAAETFGLKLSPAFEITDRNGADARDAALEETRSALERWADHPRVAPRIGLHASFTLEDITLERARALLEQYPGTGIHIHLMEGPEDREDARRRGYRSPVQRLDTFGLLGPESLLIHGVQCDAEDASLLVERGVHLVHNPTSNANNRVGFPDPGMLGRLGAGLGTDGMQADMLREAKEGIFAWSAARERDEDTPDLAAMLLRQNPRIAGSLFGRPLGHIAEGHDADLAIFDYDPRTPLSPDNATGHLLFGVTSPPRHVIAGGRWRVREGALVDVDEEQIRANARVRAAELWAAMNELR